MPSANDRLGDFTLVRHLGAGAFGEVWQAHHHLSPDRSVAVKIPTCPLYVRHLQREGIAGETLDHPAIVRPLGFEPYHDPPYMVMEYVNGCSLRELVRIAPISNDDTILIMRHILLALQHAHGRGIVHGDLKPENILIDRGLVAAKGFEAGGTVRVTDFGLGQQRAMPTSQSLVISGEHHSVGLVGTAQYMSPEQLDGAPPDAQSDLYACGVILFELLTGRRPAGVDLPSDLNPLALDELDTVFRHSFARRERRYVSAAAFLSGLAEAARIRSWSKPELAEELISLNRSRMSHLTRPRRRTDPPPSESRWLSGGRLTLLSLLMLVLYMAYIHIIGAASPSGSTLGASEPASVATPPPSEVDSEANPSPDAAVITSE